MAENEDGKSRFERAQELGQAALVPAAKAMVAGGLSMAGVPEAAVAAEAVVDAAMGYHQQALQASFHQHLEELEADVADLTAQDADGRVRLAVDALQRARAHVRREHAEAMGRVVAEAVVEPPELELDRAAVLLRIIDDLQMVHVQVLRELSTRGAEVEQDDNAVNDQQLVKLLERPFSEVQWALGDLDRQGLVSYTYDTWGGVWQAGESYRAVLMPFGRQVLEYLDG